MKSYNKMEMMGQLHSYDLKEGEHDNSPTIMGTVVLQVDVEGTTTEARFFAKPMTAKGKVNRTYAVLSDMLAGNFATVLEDGVEEAYWMGMSGTIDISYFAGRNGAQDIDDLICSQKMRGQFLNDNKRRVYKNQWICDFYITRIDDVEANEERGTDAFVRASGYIIDDYRKRALNISLEARTPQAMGYVMALPAESDNPYVVNTWGSMLNCAIKSVKKNAFGEDEVQEFESLRWTILGMEPEPYMFGDESVMTLEEWKLMRDNLDDYKKEVLTDIENRASQEPVAENPVLSF